MKKIGLTGNQLKLIALVTMTVDHMGMTLFPSNPWFRIIGRLAFPIFAYMIAEGCRYTRSMPKYLGLLAAVAAVCQAVYLVVMGSLYQCILVTFSLSVCLIALAKKAIKTRGFGWYLALTVGIAGVFFLAEVLPGLLPGTDYCVDYGFWGVMLPVLVYCARDLRLRLAATAVCLAFLGSAYGWVQWFALGALPLLALYNGQRGKHKMKYFFYIYYPAHLVVLHFVGMLLG